MSEVTRILSAIEQGDPSAASQLLPLVYDELRKLANFYIGMFNNTPAVNATQPMPTASAPAAHVPFAPACASPSMQWAVPAPAVAGAAPVPTSGAAYFSDPVIRPKPGDATDDE